MEIIENILEKNLYFSENENLYGQNRKKKFPF